MVSSVSTQKSKECPRCSKKAFKRSKCNGKSPEIANFALVHHLVCSSYHFCRHEEAERLAASASQKSELMTDEIAVVPTMVKWIPKAEAKADLEHWNLQRHAMTACPKGDFDADTFHSFPDVVMEEAKLAMEHKVKWRHRGPLGPDFGGIETYI